MKKGRGEEPFVDDHERLIKRIIKRAKRYGENIVDRYGHFPALHLPGYNYCGPGTHDFTAPPKNALDILCRQHDILSGDSYSYVQFCPSDEVLIRQLISSGMANLSDSQGSNARLVLTYFIGKRMVAAHQFEEEIFEAQVDSFMEIPILTNPSNSFKNGFFYTCYRGIDSVYRVRIICSRAALNRRTDSEGTGGRVPWVI